jgi:hypothetical protein
MPIDSGVNLKKNSPSINVSMAVLHDTSGKFPVETLDDKFV